MNSIQWTTDVHLKRIIRDPKQFIKSQYELSESSYPLIVSYLTWLRRINSVTAKADLMYQNNKIFEFKSRCTQNLLLFLTVSGQFKIIDALFKPSFSAKYGHLLRLIKKERYKLKQKIVNKRWQHHIQLELFHSLREDQFENYMLCRVEEAKRRIQAYSLFCSRNRDSFCLNQNFSKIKWSPCFFSTALSTFPEQTSSFEVNIGKERRKSNPSSTLRAPSPPFGGEGKDLLNGPSY